MAEAPRNPYGHSPLRRPHSVRRTSTLVTTWPDGRGALRRMHGRARDILTRGAEDDIEVLAAGEFEARVDDARVIRAIESRPPSPQMPALVGARGGGHLRAVLREVVPLERDTGSPLYLILDDISGASLVGAWVMLRWLEPAQMQALREQFERGEGAFGRSMENVCIGFATGSTALDRNGTPHPEQNCCPVVSLANPADPSGWHEYDEPEEMSMCRARRIDVWLEDDRVCAEAYFQDSGSQPDGSRVAVHEYVVNATAERDTGVLLSLRAEPRILPYRECPSAPDNIGRLIGVPIGELREQVIERLPGNLGCTHLNDVLRSLAEVPALVAQLPGAPRR
jgi:hypothetical protein